MLLDSGNFTGSTSAAGEIKTRALLEGMVRLGYAAVNVGERDVRLGYDELVKRTEHVDLPFVSTNIVRQDNQEPVFLPHHIVEAASADSTRKLRVGIVGVARHNPMFLKSGPEGSNLVIVEPSEPVRREVAALRAKGVDLVVLLTAMPANLARRLVADVSGIDFVIGSYGGVFTTNDDRVGETRIRYSGNQGKRLGETRAFFGENGAIERQGTQMHFLTTRYPSTDEMLEFIDAKLHESFLGAAQSALVAPASGVRSADRKLE